MSALREVQHIARDVAVWLTWFVLTLQVSHGRSYGDLRRLTPRELALHAAPIVLVVPVAAHLYVNTPPGYKFMFAAGGAMGLAMGGTLVAATLVITKAIDVSFTYR